MPQSLANVLVHLVFSTRERRPLLTPEIRRELFPYTGGILRNIECALLQVGGFDDHVHLLVRLPRTMTIAQIVEKTKTGTSTWLKTKGISGFGWQAGYRAFSVAQAEAATVVKYIQSQEEHHRVVTFQDELRALLAEAGMAFDERYVWE